MKIELKPVTIRELVEGYSYRDEKGDIVPLGQGNQEFGVVGYGGLLDIRPPYQREFVYNDKQRDRVIDSVLNELPLSVMYWVDIGNEHYEVMDGQQRTMSICEFAANNFSIEFRSYKSMKPETLMFSSLSDDMKERFLNYELLVYVCEGSDDEKLDWFNIINIAGEKLTNQELRNAVYTGPWLIDAKIDFSKTNCGAYELYKEYMKGVPIRQDYLETALKWIAHRDDITIEKYMALHQNDPNASELWQYFESVMSWVKILFPEYRKEMKGLDWGIMYNLYKDNNYNASELSKKVKELMMDEDVQRKSGIYEYLLSGNEKHLNIRSFSPAMRRAAFERQNGICPVCTEEFKLNEMEADHITPWSKGGRTNADNCQMLCKEDNRRKSNV